ncbi:MAG TPA: hypothetical protein VGC42_31335 [Kofleriaceae bacterium]
MLFVNDLPTPDWASYIEAKATVRGKMKVELFRAGETVTCEFALPTHSEPVDPSLLLDELIESGIGPLMMSEGRHPDSDPS